MTLPRKGKKAGRKPKQDPALAAAVAETEAGAVAEDAAAKHGVPARTVRDHVARRARQAAPALAGSVAPAPTMQSPSEVPVAPSQSATVAPPVDLEAVREEGRREARALDDRILTARHPAAGRELVEGRARAAESETALVAWLGRPIEGGARVDPLDACIAGLAAAVEHAERMPPLHQKTATVLGVVSQLAARVEKIAQGRPKPPTRDEVNERVRAAMDTSVAHLLRHTREAAAKLERDRAELFDGIDVGPDARAELERRVGAMLGGA